MNVVRFFRTSLYLGLLLSSGLTFAQSARKQPQLGYLFPAGGGQGKTIRVIAAGQGLKNCQGAQITGTGVQISVIRHYPPMKRLDKEERDRLANWLDQIQQGLKGDATKTNSPITPLPEHPYLDQLELLNPREAEHIRWIFLAPYMDKKKQQNAQIGELVLLEIIIDPKAPIGDRELRVMTPTGLSNPLCFQVGVVPEVRELEPNHPKSPELATAGPVLDKPLSLPVVINGQILPGDVDRFRIQGQKGQRVRFQIFARHLIPFLADAVPGWFQATIALFDEGGKELAFADDTRFEPDPSLAFRFPKTGIYEVEIRDAIYRGREDFVYRLAITRDEPTAFAPVRKNDSGLPIADYFSRKLPHGMEVEPNDSRKSAQRITSPRWLTGRIDRPKDNDYFQFKGRAGEPIVVEVFARRQTSLLDSLIRLLDSEGKVLQWNDDHETKEGQVRKETGTVTHAADSYLMATLPSDGDYLVQLADAEGKGGLDYGYHLRISGPHPDFELRMVPSSINVPLGRSVPVTIHALRRDGFTGDIDVNLAEPPQGFTLSGARLMDSQNRVQAILTAPATASLGPTHLTFEGQALIHETLIRHPVVPAEDRMQAFLYRHLTPTQECAITVIKNHGKLPPITLVGDQPFSIPKGGSIEVILQTPNVERWRPLTLSLSEAPIGITLEKIAFESKEVRLSFKADQEVVQVGLKDNLIVEASLKREVPDKHGKGKKENQVFLGVLPPIPFVIVP